MNWLGSADRLTTVVDRELSTTSESGHSVNGISIRLSCMSRDLTPGSGPDPETDTEPPASTTGDEMSTTTEAGEPRLVDPFGSDERLAEPAVEFSLVDPLSYAPLLLVGTLLIGIPESQARSLLSKNTTVRALLVGVPEPATTFIGLLCITAGMLLALVDLLSPSSNLV